MKVLSSIIILAFVALSLSAADQTSSTEGLLTAKGEYFLQVTPEGSESAIKFVPVWKGGLPKDGGAFDKDTLTNIKDVKIGSKIRVDWKQDEFKRIVKVAVLEQPKPIKPPEPEMHAKSPPGVTVGIIQERRRHRVVIKLKSGEPESIGYPTRDGGEPNPEMLQGFHEGDLVRIEWIQQGERRVMTKVTRAEQ